MKVNVTMIARNRHKLTDQTLASLRANTDWSRADFTFLDDGSQPPLTNPISGTYIYMPVPLGGAGPARNAVIKAVTARKDLLYLSDNDIVTIPHWLDTLTEVWPFAYALGFRVLGGYSHPFNAQSIGTWPLYSDALHKTIELRECLAVATQSWLMDWETWDKYGPFAEAPGVRQSEDVAFCTRLRNDGFKVGYVYPFVVWSTSKTDTFGQLVPGHELIEAPAGILVE